jgi:hypothetical protein
MVLCAQIIKHMQTHVIVQAGGRGSRLRHHTWNKPKCLVSVKGKPLLYHLFDRFPQARFHIIGDYAFDQLERYLQVNPPGVCYDLTRAIGKGTATGIRAVLETIPSDDPVVLTWSDLIIGSLPPWPATDRPVVFTTDAFTCRWTVTGTDMREEPGGEGIVGLFYFPTRQTFPEPPAEGEFVRWFSKNISNFETCLVSDLEELGDFDTIETNNQAEGFARFFNEVIVESDHVIKQARLESYQHLIDKELQWYHDIELLGFRRIPRVLGRTPLTMQRIHGCHAYTMQDLTLREKRSVLADYLDSLQDLHQLGDRAADDDDLRQVYLEKTRQRVHSVANLIPGYECKSMTVNGMKCRNVFADGSLDDLFTLVRCDRFTPIHGDPTFSNSLIDHNLKVWFIDPRGYFHRPGVWGDPGYDFAKVYYSARGGYDAFNRRQFKLHVDSETVEIIADVPLFSNIADDLFREFFGTDLARIKILHGLIWLSLSGYVKDDIDSIIGSFYLGLYWLEKGLRDL